MGFRINTNVAALDAHKNAVLNNRSLDNSLSRLSSGLRINKAADDASGMAIADSLRMQANSLGQAIANANDGIGIIQTADKAMDEQLKILDTIKSKAIQAANDGQNQNSREAIQKDVNRLIEQLDNIAKTTTFNGMQLLSGKFSNREFQIGAFSNQTIKASINNTQSVGIGNIQSRDDHMNVGNFVTMTTSNSVAKGSSAITLHSTTKLNGLGAGDTIKIDGVGEYTIQSIDGAVSKATASGVTIYLDRGIEKELSSGTGYNISITNTVSENLSVFSTGAKFTSGGTLTISAANNGLTGFSVGDVIVMTDSQGVSSEFAITTITGNSAGLVSGTMIVSYASGATSFTVTAGTTMVMKTRNAFGSDYSGADYLQYTIEGKKLTGVQITDENGYGVAGTGLGKMADIINESTNLTGVKAVANTTIDSNIKVQGMSLFEDIIINGETIMQQGDTLLSGDSNSALLNAINTKTSLTGVTASLQSDGTLTLASDGRAIDTKGLSGAAGITDGVHAGKIEFTKTGLEVVDITSSHYTNAGLTATNGSADSANEIVSKNTLNDVVFGKTDTNEDGVINSGDAVGLLMSKEGAQITMNIVEAAIKELDAIRADLGSVQNQLTVTVNNISVTRVNVQAAESQLRDVDFAAESASFSKFNILAQSGSYAMSQANAVQQNVLRLLQ